MHLVDEMPEHRLGDFEVGDDAVLQRADGHDVARSAPQHAFGLVAHGEHVIRAHLHRYHRRLAEHDVAKPSGLPTLPGGGEFLEHTLLNLVRRRHPEANPMHRLGRCTSGVVLFAPDAVSGKTLQAAFQAPGTRKVYRALCCGHPEIDAFEITAPIGEVPYGPLGFLHAANPQGRPSISRVSVLERHEEASLVDVEILTGRPHQIRIHLAWAGHPLVGDPLYGPGGTPLPGTRAVPGDPGYLLHAHRLELAHPRTGSPVLLECQPPPVLRTSNNS